MKQLIASALMLFAVASSANAEPRDLARFTQIVADGRFDVEVAMGDRQSVDISGLDARRVAATVSGGELKLEPSSRPWFGPEPALNALVRITLPRLDSIAAARGAQIRAAGLRSNSLSLTAAMGGAIDANGLCGHLDASAAMGGIVHAPELDCADASVSAAMGGHASIHARNAIVASAAMGGQVEVQGAPTRRETSSSMGGGVTVR